MTVATIVDDPDPYPQPIPDQIIDGPDPWGIWRGLVCWVTEGQWECAEEVILDDGSPF
jgi:hypothetical protein